MRSRTLPSPSRLGWDICSPADCFRERPAARLGSLADSSSFASPAIPPIERVSGMGNVIRVVLGSDFSSVNPPSPSGSSVQVHVVHDRSSESSHLPEDLTVTNAADTTCE